MNTHFTKTIWQLLVIAITIFISCGCSSHPDYKKAEEYIRESEKQWAESVASGDSSVIIRILEDDFVGVDPDGSHYDKQKMVHGTATAPEYFLSNHLNDVDIRFYGNTAVAQGNESWVRKKDSVAGKFVWTDTWIYRNSKWQIVAAEDLIAPIK